MELVIYIVGSAVFAAVADWLRPQAPARKIVGMAMAVLPAFWLLATIYGYYLMINDHVGHVGAMAFGAAGMMLMSSLLWSLVLVAPTAWLTLRYLRSP